MADANANANEMNDAIVREPEDVVVRDSNRTEGILYREDADFHDFPPSLLRYFATSKSRAAVCEKLIRVEPEDTTASHHTDDTMNGHIEVDKDPMTLNEQVICGSAKENNTSTDIRPFPAPTETEALFTHNVSVCPNNEDEAGTNAYMKSERHLPFEMRIPNKTIEYEAEQDKRESKEVNEERKTQTERDFQRELRRIVDAEKRHQKELEVMEKRAQEKLEKEFLLQQELISSLQRQVEEERRMREEEQKRIKEERDKRKKEEENIKMEAERRRTEEEMRRKKEEDRQIEEMKCKNNEEEMGRIVREKKNSEEDERKKIESQRKKQEDEMRMTKDEEMTIKRDEEMGKREDEIKKIEEAGKKWDKMEKEKRKMEEQSDKKEDELRKKDGKERKKMEEENMRIEEEGRVTKDIKERKMRKKNENDEAGWKKLAQEKMCEELGKGDKREQGKVDELKPVERKRKEENYSEMTEEVEKVEVKNKEMERKTMEERIDRKEVVRKQEGEHGTSKEIRSNEEDEKRKLEDERKTKEEEQRRLQKETRRHGDDKDVRKSEEKRLHKDECDGHVDNKTRGQERKTKDAEKKNDGKSESAEKEKNEEEVGEKNGEVARAIRANEAPKKMEHDSIVGQDENVVQQEVTAKIEDDAICTSSSPGPSRSTIRPTTDEVRQTSAGELVDRDSQAAKASSASVRLAACLPRRTEHKRLSWAKDCVPWSDLSHRNARRRRVSAGSKRGARRAAGAGGLPPLSPRSLLQSTGWRSLQEVTTVTLEDLPGCSLSTLAQCPQLQSLSLRRCGLKSLEGISQLQQLCYIDVQENDISYVDCENMPSLRVLHLGHNKLTSIHGLAGAENLDVLELSHNSITRIAGLESMRRLQRLSVDHNQLISTKGLKDVYTLLHLNCSHNHLARVEGLENNALLNTLDLRANSLAEPPGLYNQVLLRELYLDDNSISSLRGLTACWLPLMQHLSVAQNRITQLPPVSDALSLSKLDLQFNCMSELQNVCESLEGCQFLREIRLTGNPLQQETGWRSSLQTAVPGLRAIDDQETDSHLSPPAVQQVHSASDGGFLMFCQAQLRETRDLQQRHGRELSNVSSSLDAMKISCRHFDESLQLATDQRFAHERGDATVAAGQTAPEEMLDVDRANSEKHAECPETESAGEASPSTPNGDSIGCSCRTLDEKPVVESGHDVFDTLPKPGPTVSRASSGSAPSLAMKGDTSSNLELAPVSNRQDLDLKNTAAVVIQRRWRKYRQKCEKISGPITAEKGGGGDGGEPESGPSHIHRSVVGRDHAATVIQAFWRGFVLRRRLTSALTAVTCLDTREDDTFEEVDMNVFVFDEAELENNWILPLSEDSAPRYDPVSERPLHLKPPGPFPDPSQSVHPPPVAWEWKQAWVSPEQVDPCVQRVPPVSSDRSCSPASASVVSGLSERSEKILEEWGFTHSHTAHLMLKRAKRMKPKRQQPKKYGDPSNHLASVRHHSCQPGKVEGRSWQAEGNRKYVKVGEAELGPRQAERTEEPPLQREGVHADSESEHFLPEISPDLLNGGRVQLVADPGYAERLHLASGSWASSSFAGRPSKENDYPQRNSLSHGREKVPSPQQAPSAAPSRRERISFRDNPVRMSGGWGGGKKRSKI